MCDGKCDEGERLSDPTEFRHRRKTGMDRGCCRQTVTSKMTTLVEAVRLSQPEVSEVPDSLQTFEKRGTDLKLLLVSTFVERRRREEL